MANPNRIRIKVSDAEHVSATRGLKAHERTIRARRPPAPDFDVSADGSIVLIHVLSEACRTWIDEHANTEGWQWLGNTLAIDQRFAGDLIDGLVSAGLTGRE